MGSRTASKFYTFFQIFLVVRIFNSYGTEWFGFLELIFQFYLFGFMACVAQIIFWERQIMLSHDKDELHPREITYATAYDRFKIQDSIELKSAVYEVQIEMYRFIVAVIG